MIRGIYASGSGMIAEMDRIDVTANNLANGATPGFKKDVAVLKDFKSLLIQRINDGQDRPVIGSLGVGSTVDAIVTDHSQGGIRTTGNPLDMALEGDGFFTVETPAGVRYTRNGSFTRSAGGEMVTQEGYRVLGQGGPIQLGDPGSKINISEDGRVLVDNAEADQLRIVRFEDPRLLKKEGEALYSADATQQEQESTARVRSEALELSNVNVVKEMVNMISGYRAYEINSKAVQSHDQLLDKAVNEVGRV